jgi:hypothetical protein
MCDSCWTPFLWTAMIPVFWYNRKDYMTGNIVAWHSFGNNRFTGSNVLSFMTDELETTLYIKEKRLHPHISSRRKWGVNRDEPRQTNFNTLHIFRSGLYWNSMNQARIKQSRGCISIGNQASDIRIQLHNDMFSLESLNKLSSLPPDNWFLHNSKSDVTVRMLLGLLKLVKKCVTVNSIKSVHWYLKVIGVCWQHSMTTACRTKQHTVVRKITSYNSVANMHHIILK